MRILLALTKFSVKLKNKCLKKNMVKIDFEPFSRKYIKYSPIRETQLYIKYMNQKYILFSLLFIFLFAVHYNIGKKNEFNNFSDYALFGGDTWEYQSLAVNLLHGHGYQFGGIEPLEVYKFAYTSRYKTFFDSETDYSFYRTPGYPFFLKTIYQIHGIHPGIAKKYQFIMIIISVSLMPLICYYYFGYLGVISGTLSSFFFMKYLLSDLRTGTLLTESLMVFSILVWMFALIFWEKKPTKNRIILLGIVSGLLLLVKGSTIFIPFIFLILLFRYYSFSQRKKIAYMIIYIFSILTVVTPWSIYATIKSDRFVLLSTQGDTMLADCNNKQAALTGDWSTNWPTNDANLKYIFFNRPDGSTKKNVLTALNFYIEDPSMIFVSIKNKIIFATQYRPTKFCLMFSLLYLLLYIITSRFKSDYKFKSIPTYAIIIFINIFLLTIVFYGSRRMLVPYMYFLLIPSVHFLFLIPIYINTVLEKHELGN